MIELRKRPIITLLTDFGLIDSYVAEIKAVILSICPETYIIDISHNIRKFDIKMGSFLLMRASKFFPKGTIHVAIVDPEVGGERRPIMVECERNLYVGPDNGLLIPSARREGIKHIYVIENPKYMLKEISRTFHGRDIFGPAAAYLAKGVPPSEFGREIFDPIVPSFAEPKVYGDFIEGEVIHIDNFGNIITNITYDYLRSLGIKEGSLLGVRLKDKDLRLKLCSAYSEAEINMPLLIVGSADFLEISVNRGNASKFFGVRTDEKIIIYKISE
ncbi:MAG: SAM-dependent chlorinase/fluorinase [Candidatus Bathyarchaeia archaeon]